MEDPGSNPPGGKKTSTELEYFKSNSAGARTYNLRDYNQIFYHCATLSCYSCMSTWKYLFLSFSGNLALCVVITNLRVAELRKINANTMCMSLAQEWLA